MTWLAADYDTRLIKKFFERQEGWPEISYELVYYYRDKHRVKIEELRVARRESAINTGLALREERVARLKEHADALEAIKWETDEKGRMWNEKAWRETLEAIATEVGHRKQTVEHSGPNGGPIKVQSDHSDAQLIQLAEAAAAAARARDAAQAGASAGDELADGLPE